MSLPGLIEGTDGECRCWWAGTDPLYCKYHDEEWGRPVADDRRLFEKICLEGFQAGLSWLTILKKRENFRRAFDDFKPEKIVNYNGKDAVRLFADPGIVRHRAKIESVINNAARALELEDEFGSLAGYFWQWEPHPGLRPGRFDHATIKAITKTETSLALSKDLKKRGWSFVGPTTIYAFMQAMGLVNDHLEGCRCRSEIEQLRQSFKRPIRH